MSFTPYRLAVVAGRKSEEPAGQSRGRFGTSVTDRRLLVRLAHVGDGV